MVKYLRDPQEFGGNYPTPTLSRRDRDYHDQTGDYWRGGIWLPTTYMTVKALEEYGYHEEADMIAEKSSASSLPLTTASNRTRYGNVTAPVPTSRLPNMAAGPVRNFAAGRRWAPFPSLLKTFWDSIRFLHSGMKSSGD